MRGHRYRLTTLMRLMTAYGFDASGVHLTDPGTAVWRLHPCGQSMAMWNVTDGMALSILP